MVFNNIYKLAFFIICVKVFCNINYLCFIFILIININIIKANATSVWAKMTQILSKISIIFGRIKRDVLRNVHRSPCEVPFVLSDTTEM